MIAVARALVQWSEHIQRICAELGITHATILAEAGRQCWANTADRVINIDPDECFQFGMHPVRVVAHELRHLQQAATGRLQGSVYATMWDGVLHIVGPSALHRELPWERDANEYEADYMERYGAGLETSETRELHRTNYLGPIAA